jgi:hypothetical protein
MTNKTSFVFLFACAALTAQDQPGSAAIPPESGIYYQAPSGWVALRSTLWMPVLDPNWKSLMSVGRREATMEMPGANSAFRINDARPTFVVRGLSPATGLYLVRSNRKQDYRELRMPVSGRITQWTRFRDKDVSAIDIEPLFPDVVRIRPHADLAPGEYVIVSDLEPRYRAMRLGFEFGVLGTTSRR